ASGSVFPPPGLSESTRPFLTVREKARLMVPTSQCAAVMADSVALRLLPFIFGTTHTVFAGVGPLELGGAPRLTTRFTGGPCFSVRCATEPALGSCDATRFLATVAEYS